MLKPRIIPCLLLKNNSLLKTVNFKNPKYVGDPINAVKIFNEKEVDELMVLDIHVSSHQLEPQYALIEKLAMECRMPFCYGGGIKSAEQAKRIISLGVEKVAVSSAAVRNPELITQIAEQIGNQSIVVVLDVKKNQKTHQDEIWINNGEINTNLCPVQFAKQLQGLGAGEIIVNSIDHDGVMKGYNLDLIRKIKSVITVPMTALGGAGSLDDIQKLFAEHKIIGAAAGSLFVFKGAYKAVLINYPNRQQKDVMIGVPDFVNVV